MVSCEFNKYSEGVRNDTKKIFKKNKEFIYSLDFQGKIIKKKVCADCEINKYTLTIKIDSISEQPLIRNKQYPPYYTFISDSILDLSVNASLFEKVQELDGIEKRSKSHTLKVNKIVIQFISKEDFKWLP
jgi:hypothetical protein